MCVKCCVSLPYETLAQMDFLRDYLHLNPAIKRSQLLQQIVFDLYMRCYPFDMRGAHQSNDNGRL